MAPEEYRDALGKLGFSQEGIAAYVGVGKRTSQGYALGEYPIPTGVAVILRLMIAGKIAPEDIEAAHGR